MIIYYSKHYSISDISKCNDCGEDFIINDLYTDTRFECNHCSYIIYMHYVGNNYQQHFEFRFMLIGNDIGIYSGKSITILILGKIIHNTKDYIDTKELIEIKNKLDLLK